MLEEDLGLPLADIELRTSLTPDGQVRLDVIATDLLAGLLSAYTGTDANAVNSMMSRIPDLSVVIIGGTLAGNELQGRVVILLLAEDIRFVRLQ